MRNGGTGVWQGFDFAWSRTPHRVHRLGSWLDDLHGDELGVRGRCETRFSVGRVPDSGVARTHIGGIRSRALRFREGSVSVSLGASNGEAAEIDGARVEVEIDGDATAILRGFELTCTSHETGIHPQGFGVQLRRIASHDGVLSFTPRFYVHAANSPDIVTGWRGDFQFSFEARYTVLSGRPDAVSFELPCDDRACAEIGHGRRERPVSAGRIAGQPERYRHGVLGLRGFRWEQQHQSWRGRNGRFLRRLEAHMGERRYDPHGGVMDFKPRMSFSNDGLIPYPVRAQHRMWCTLIQYRDDRPRLAPQEIAHTITSGVGDGAEGRSVFELGPPQEGEARESS